MKYLILATFLPISSILSAGGVHAETTFVPQERDLPPNQANTKFVTKLAGLVLFVGNNCPNSKIDYDRFKDTVTKLGVKVDDLSKDPIKIESLSYFSAYQQDVDGNCTRAQTEFGADGKIIRGIFSKK